MKKTPEGKSLSKYVAFLRGINVGGHSIIKMEELRKAFESLGFRNVKTVLASGNVLFEALQESTTALSKRIALKLKDLLGRETIVIVQPVEALRELEVGKPFEGVDVTTGARLFVTFVADGVEGVDSLGPSIHDGFRILSVSNGTICSVLYELPGVGAVELMGTIEKAFGRKVTTRSWDTIIKILGASDKT
jgi:uncharacterized protein (DUF1697 family)